MTDDKIIIEAIKLATAFSDFCKKHDLPKSLSTFGRETVYIEAFKKGYQAAKKDEQERISKLLGFKEDTEG